MKKISILALTLLVSLGAAAGDHLFIVTDRNTYIAGDQVFCSVFALDEKGRNSEFSAVSYLELISADGTVTEAKIGLFNGRGAGSFRIPTHTPTGNYKLVGYTSRSAAHVDTAPVLSVFNTTSTARVSNGIRFVPEGEYRPASPEADAQRGLSLTVPRTIRQGRSATLYINAPTQDADIVVSIYHQDNLPSQQQPGLDAFPHTTPLAGTRKGEYEGEIIYASVEGLEGGSNNPEHVTAFLSTSGAHSNVYIGKPGQDGQLQFYTGNIYGDHELVCEVVSMYGKSCHISLKSPFTHPEPGEIPRLELSGAQRGSLVSRKASLQADLKFPLDTLLEFLPKREDLLLEGIPCTRYHLDDYTSFPTVREICIEFIPQLSYSRVGDRWRLRMNVSDATDSRRFQQDNILVLMDGVVLTDHGMLADFDATLLSDILIYEQPVVIGELSYNGVVNFVTRKNYVTALQFPENTRVVDFRGVSYPVAYSGAVPAQGKDLRQLLYWHPALQLVSGQDSRIPFHAPAYSGRFRVVVQGRFSDGTPIYATGTFEVE